MSPEKTPASPSREYTARDPDRKLITDVVGGLPAIVREKERYLTRWTNETPESFTTRLRDAVWTPLFDDILFGLASKPFSKEVSLRDGASARLEEWCEDVDGQGNNLHVFAQRAFEMAVRDGRVAVLVDYPAGPPPLTMAQEAASGRRPYFVLIPDADLIALYTERQNGRDVIAHARIREREIVRDGWGEAEVERIRVLEPGRWSLYRRDDSAPGRTAASKWLLEDEGVFTPLRFVPMVVFEVGDAPPLAKIARLQIELFRQENNLKSILNRTAFPIFAANGMSAPSEKEKTLTIGPGAILFGGDGGSWSILEPQGTTIQQLREVIDGIKTEMRRLGMQPLLPGTGTITATASGIEAAKAHSAVQMWALKLKDALEQMLAIMGAWVGEQVEAEVFVNTDFGIELADRADDQTILALYEQGVVSKSTVRDEMKRRGRLSADYDGDEDDERIEEETAAAMALVPDIKPGPDYPTAGDPDQDEDADVGVAAA